MCRTVCLLAALLVLPSLGSDSPPEYDGATALEAIEGSWVATAVESQGLVLNQDESKRWTFTFSGGKLVYKSRSETLSGTYTFDPFHKPAHLDFLPNEGEGTGKVWKMLAQIDGDTLRIAFPGDNKSRPTGFGDEYGLRFTCRRVKK